MLPLMDTLYIGYAPSYENDIYTCFTSFHCKYNIYTYSLEVCFGFDGLKHVNAQRGKDI